MIILTRLALRSRTVTVMILILVLAGGVYAYQQLQQELFPEISLRVINVVTSYQQGTPYQVSQDVTKPVEDLIIGMEGLKEVTSTSRATRSQVRQVSTTTWTSKKPRRKSSAGCPASGCPMPPTTRACTS